MPATANIAALFGLLTHLGNNRIAGHGGEETIDIDRAKPLGEADVLVGREALIAKKDHPVFTEGAPDLGECPVMDRRRQINSADLGADCPRERFYPYVVVGHSGVLPRGGQSQLTLP